MIRQDCGRSARRARVPGRSVKRAEEPPRHDDWRREAEQPEQSTAQHYTLTLPIFARLLPVLDKSIALLSETDASISEET